MGLEELTNIRNVERLKKELRVRLWDVSDVRIPKSCPFVWNYNSHYA